MSEAKKMTKFVNLRVDEDTWKMLVDEENRTGAKKAEIIRRAIKNYIGWNKAKENPEVLMLVDELEKNTRDHEKRMQELKEIQAIEEEKQREREELLAKLLAKR